jgi:hypothetical protein
MAFQPISVVSSRFLKDSLIRAAAWTRLGYSVDSVQREVDGPQGYRAELTISSSEKEPWKRHPGGHILTNVCHAYGGHSKSVSRCTPPLNARWRIARSGVFNYSSAGLYKPHGRRLGK